MKRIKTRSALTVLFLTSLTFPAHPTMNGSSEATAFTHIGMINKPLAPITGYLWFNLSGNIIRTYVNNGEVLVLRDHGTKTGDLPVNSDWYSYSLGRFILPSAALAELDGITRLRLFTGGPGVTGNLVLDAVTTNSTMIQKVRDNETLHRGYLFSENLDDNTPNASWVDTVSTVATNSSFLTGTAAGRTNGGETLDKNVFHANGAAGSTVFIPSQNHQVVKWVTSTETHKLITAAQYYSLTVLADEVAVPLATGSGADFNKLVVTKTASKIADVIVDDEITYTYVITNYTADMITDISMSDVHDGKGTFGQPDIETGTITEGTNSVTGDSYDLVDNDKWDGLAPGDALTVTATYTVTQADIDELQSP